MKAASIRIIVGLACGAVFALSSVAAAEGLFEQPGHIGLAPTGWSFIGTRFFGQDADGYIYDDRGGFGCHLPSEDPDTALGLGDVNFFDGNGTRVGFRTFALLTPDRSAVDVAYFPLYPYWQQTNIEAVRLFRVSCAELAAGGPAAATQLGGTIMQTDNPLLARIGSAPEFTRLPSGALCFPTVPEIPLVAGQQNGIVCIDTSTTPPTFSQLVDSDALDVALDVDPGLARGAYHLDGTPPDAEYWALSGVTTAPGDRLFFIADRTFVRFPPAAGRYHARYVVERSADGTLTTRFGPIVQSTNFMPAFNAFMGAGQLVYSAQLDAVLAWPVLNQEYNAADYAQGGWGWSGIGFRVIPLDQPGSGYLPLSRHFAARLACEDELSFCNRFADTNVVTDASGVHVTVWHGGANPNSYEHEVYTLLVDPDAVDLDDDGLDAAAEAALGTWDTVPDSDGRGTPDGVEVLVSQTDPTDPSDDPAGQVGAHGIVRYAPSMLIRSRLSVSSDDIRRDNLRTAGVNGPMCVAGHCYGPEGEVATWPVSRQLPGTWPVVAADGTFIMIEAADGLVRFYFEDGREELAVTRAALDGYIPTRPQNLRFVPVDAERTWLASDGTHFNQDWEPAIVGLAVGDAPIAIIYDHAQAQRDSGLTVAADDFVAGLEDAVAASISIIGWNDDTQQLQIGVRGNWDSYLIGLSGDGSQTLLGNGRARAGMNALAWYGPPSLYEPYLPPYLLPTGHGDYLTSGGLTEPFGFYADARLTGYNLFERAPFGIWGDVLLESVCCGFEEDGLYELVRYDQSVRPGDLLWMKPAESVANAMMLFKSGPRGGLVEAWSSGLPDLLDASGIDLAPDGSMRLCVADAVANVVWELEPAGPDGPPEVVRYAADVPGIIDCAYDAAGALSVLAIGPARVETRDGDFGDLAVAESLPSAPVPIELLRRADGTNEVRLRGDGLRGKAYLPDGRQVTMLESDFQVRIDGTPVVNLPRMVYINDLSEVNPDHAAGVAFAVRPDGLIAVVPRDAAHAPPYATRGRAYLVDPAGGGYLLAKADAMGGAALVVVPGGVNADPWTGRVRGPAVVVPPGITPPVVPAPPSGGDRVAAAGGCAGGAPGTPLWLFFAAVVTLAGRAWPKQRRRSAQY